MPRNACVIQITPVRLTRTSANDASVVRKIYLSIDPMRYRTNPHQSPNAVPGISGSPTTHPAREPQGRCSHLVRRSASHYHPFDPSTKWPPHGTLNIWL